MEDLIFSLNEQIKKLDIFCQYKTEKVDAIGLLEGGMSGVGFMWQNNPQLQTQLEELKNSSNDVAKSCIKIGILSKDPLIDLSLLFSELAVQTKFTHSSFLLLIEHSALSRCLMEWISSSVRELMVQVKALVEHVRDNNAAGVTMLAGLVSRVNDESIQKLPASNRIALRRYILQSCTVTKDTVEEFRTYLAESSDDAVTKKIDVEEEDDDDDEDEDDVCRYVSMEERAAVGACVDIMIIALDAMKLSLKAITTISDAICTQNGDINEEVSRCGDRWVEMVAQSVKEVEGDIVDLGAELYPPVDLTYLSPGALAEGEDGEEAASSNLLVKYFICLSGRLGRLLQALPEPTLTAFYFAEFESSIELLRAKLDPLSRSFPSLIRS